MVDDELILLAWDAVSSDEALGALLRRLAEAFGCHSAALVYKDRLTPAADITLAYGPFADPEVQRRYALEFSALDPAPAALGRLPVGEVADTDSLFSLDDRERYRAFLDGFYHPLGLAGALGAPLVKGDERIGMVAVHRGGQRPAFDHVDARRMRSLVPHLARMIELRQTFFALDARAARLDDALESMRPGMLMLDSDGVLAEANRVARALFARRDGLVLTRDGQVIARDADAARMLRDAMASREGMRIVRVPRDDVSEPYILCVRWRPSPPGWTIVVSDSEREAGPRAGQLAAALDLSCAAAELLMALVAGETLNSFCSRRSMSRNTAKYHLRAAFVATATNRQSDLVRRATTILRDLGL